MTPADYIIAHNAGRHAKRRVARCSLCVGTSGGVKLTKPVLDRIAKAAEAGYDPAKFKPRAPLKKEIDRIEREEIDKKRSYVRNVPGARAVEAVALPHMDAQAPAARPQNGDLPTPTAKRRGRPPKAGPGVEPQAVLPSADGLFGALYHAHRQREDYLSLEQVFATRIGAAQRRDPEMAALVVGDFEAHVKQLRSARRQWEKTLTLLASQLPVANWIVKDVRGISLMGLAQVIAETGDLSTYSNPAKVWKRMGLAVINGEAQGRRRGAAGIEHGFSPRRRRIMWNLSDGLVKQNKGELRAYYDTEKARQALKLPEAAPFIIDGRARRHLAKRFLRELWRVWRAHDPVATGLPLPASPPADTTSPPVMPTPRARRAKPEKAPDLNLPAPPTQAPEYVVTPISDRPAATPTRVKPLRSLSRARRAS